MSLINREELLKSIMDDGGLQYPRWWYLDKVREMPDGIAICEDCRYWDKFPLSSNLPDYHRCLIWRRSSRRDEFCSRGRRAEDGRPD